MIAEAWQTQKERLTAEMAAFTPKQGRQDQISADLAGYSELSRAYDATRAHFWNQALDVLSPKQRARLAGGVR